MRIIILIIIIFVLPLKLYAYDDEQLRALAIMLDKISKNYAQSQSLPYTQQQYQQMQIDNYHKKLFNPPPKYKVKDYYGNTIATVEEE